LIRFGQIWLDLNEI